MSDELRRVLSRLPSKRAAARAFAERRDTVADPAWRDLWGLLAAETATLDAAEREAFRVLTDACHTPRTPPE